MNRAADVAGGDPELGVAALVEFLLRHTVLVGLVTIAGGLLALGLALTAIPIYRAQVVVTDAVDRGMDGRGPLVSQLTGLAGLAGVAAPSQASQSQEAAAVLDSRYLVEDFIRVNNLLPVLSGHSTRPPTLWLAVKGFKDGVVSIRRDERKGTTTVGIEWRDPVVAAQWANGFVGLANELIRRRVLEESTRDIAYLNDQLAKTNVVELRKVIYDLIDTETKNLMLANGRTEYAYEVIDPAVPPEQRARPHRTLMVLIGLALGLALGIGAAVVAERFRRLGPSE